MAETCPECGASIPEGGSCKDNFHALLLQESRISGGLDAILHVYLARSRAFSIPTA